MIELNKLYLGDCIEVMKDFEDNCIDSIVTDPPYGIGFMGKGWDTFNPEYVKENYKPQRKKLVCKYDIKNGVRIYRKKPEWVARESSSDYAGSYDFSLTGNRKFQEWFTIFSKECLRVLKPGGHLLSFGGTRTYHRMVCAIEDAGFEIRDCLQWIYGSGFPKNLDIGKQIDKIKGAKREILKINPNYRPNAPQNQKIADKEWFQDRSNGNITIPATPEAKQWDGYGTALKPANEPIVLARKPISEKNIAENVLKWGTGGINIDKCRIGINPNDPNQRPKGSQSNSSIWGSGKNKWDNTLQMEKGRWPANVIFDEEAAALLDEMSGKLTSGSLKKGKPYNHSGCNTMEVASGNIKKDFIANSGFASRFFYVAKASKSERNAGLEGFEAKAKCEINKMGGAKCTMKTGSGNERNVKYLNNHPTVKPIKLMRYLVRLITPPNGICLDPFIGSGTTAIACIEEGFDYIGIEKEKEYFDIAKARIKHIEKRPKGFFKPSEVQSEKISRQKGFF